MYGHYRNTGIPRLQNYQHALDRFNSTKPIRGRTDVSKPMYPLGHRNKVDSFWMMKCPLTQDVECYLYRTPVVTFKSNGEVHIKSGGWSSISTANFIGEVLGGVSAYIYDHSLCVHTWSEKGSEQYRVPESGSLVLRKEGRWQYVSGAPNNVIHSMNRKAINAARKTYKDFKQYAIAMLKLRDGRVELDEYGAAFGKGVETPNLKWNWDHKRASEWLVKMKDWMSDQSEDKHNAYYKALLMCVRCTGYYSALTPAEFDNVFRWVTTGLHRDEVLVEEVLPLGKLKKDNYGQYFRKTWSKYHEIKPEVFALGEKHE